MQQAFLAEKQMRAYLETHSITYAADVCGGVKRLNVLYTGCKRSPGQMVEG